MAARRQHKIGLARHLRRTITVGERLWLGLRSFEGARFRRQATVGPYVLDSYAPSIKLCIELDDPYHEAERDKLRDDWLAKKGI